MSKVVSPLESTSDVGSPSGTVLEQYIRSVQLGGSIQAVGQTSNDNSRSDGEDTNTSSTDHSIDISNAPTQYPNTSAQQEQNSIQSLEISTKKQSMLLESSLNSLPMPVLIMDTQSNVRFANVAFRDLFCDLNAELTSKNQLLRQARKLLVDHSVFERFLHQIHDAPRTTIEAEIEMKDGRCIEILSAPHVLDDDIVGQIWQFRDISQSRLNEEESKHRAYHDSLTGLPNRRLLSLRINEFLLKLADTGQKMAVLFIDLDGFKDVNDSLGHNVGDALLKEVATRLESSMPPETFLARHGGDEFIAVMENIIDEKQATDLSHKIIDSFDTHFAITGEEIYMSVSIGIAIAPLHGNDADKLVSHADMAMYQAKQHGKHTYEVFCTDKDTQAYQRLKIRNQISVALEQEEFELFFQPKVCLDTGTIRGAEALIRWRLSNGEFRNPMEFIPLAEESGQIIPLSQWVIRRCCQYLQEWKDELDDDFVLAMNISAKHFVRAQLQQDLAKAISTYNVDPSKLEIEVTETALMDNLELAVETLKELRSLGIGTAIDDFGTGHSSLSYLRRLPIEVLKIDKSFIDEILTSSEDRTLVRGIIEMVHALGMVVVAEGVENHEMAEMLMDMDCDLVQGYHYCRPVPEQNFMKLIRSRQCYI